MVHEHVIEAGLGHLALQGPDYLCDTGGVVVAEAMQATCLCV
jgi:hypothetical protein